MRFRKCAGCGKDITEDICGVQTDVNGYTYCCGWNVEKKEFRRDKKEIGYLKRRIRLLKGKIIELKNEKRKI